MHSRVGLAQWQGVIPAKDASGCLDCIVRGFAVIENVLSRCGGSAGGVLVRCLGLEHVRSEVRSLLATSLADEVSEIEAEDAIDVSKGGEFAT